MEVLVIKDLVMFDRGAFVQKMKGGVFNTPLCRGFIIRHCSGTMRNFDKVKYTFYFHDKQVHTTAKDYGFEDTEGYAKVKCKLLSVRGVNEMNIELLDDRIDDYNYIYLAPEYWIINRMAAGLIAAPLFMYLLAAITLADLKGHFSSKLFFDPKEEMKHEAHLNILIYQERGSDLTADCYVFWIANYAYTALTLVDLICCLIYIFTVPMYNWIIPLALQACLAVPYLVFAICSCYYTTK